MALLHVFHPPVQTYRGEGLLYIFNIFWAAQVLDPITNPSFGGGLAAPYYSLTCIFVRILYINTYYTQKYNKTIFHCDIYLLIIVSEFFLVYIF